MNTEKTVDLHSHSYCSDGTFSPEGLVILAKKCGLAALALTDHDTVDGLSTFTEAGKKHGLETINGIELAAEYKDLHHPELHIVGLGIDPAAPCMMAHTQYMQKSRNERNIRMVEKLNALGFSITLDEVEKNAGGEIVTRAHFANVLLKKGYISNRGEAFKKYLSPGMPGYARRILYSPAHCISLIHEAGGISILAHPTLYDLNEDELRQLCGKLVKAGLMGIECMYSTYTKGEEKMIASIAADYGLLSSGGSDFHGENKPDISLGIGKGRLSVPYSYLDEIKKHIKVK